LAKEKVPRNTASIRISPNWEQYRQRDAVKLKPEPEPLTSNWLRVIEIPDTIRYFSPTGAVDHAALHKASGEFIYHAQPFERGFFSFASLSDVNKEFAHVGKFEIRHEIDATEFVANGFAERGIKSREASNWVQTIFRKAWESWARQRGLLSFAYSSDLAFHVSRDQAKIGQRFSWGIQGEKRSSMLRNIAKKHVWSFGITALPSFWPYFHFKLKSRVLFSEVSGDEAGPVIVDKAAQHRLRRSVCKGWRNPQWHGRLRALLEMLAGDAPYINLGVGSEAAIKLESLPIFFTSPVTTELPAEIDDETDEGDDSTLTGPPPDEDDPE
jgi:hypothetical protein